MSGSSVSHHKRQMLSRHDVTRTLATAPLQEIDSYKTKLYVTGWGGEGGGGGGLRGHPTDKIHHAFSQAVS